MQTTSINSHSTQFNQMAFLLLCVVSFLTFSQGTQAEYCLSYTYNYYSSSYDSTYTYCSNGCCGIAYFRYCCSDSDIYSTTTASSYYTSYYSTYTYWSIETIIGAVIGGIIGLCVLITIIVIIVKACTKSGSHGRVIHPVQPLNHPNMFVMGTGTHCTMQPYPLTQPGMPPPNYPGPSGNHPPPGPVYPNPAQSSGQPGAPEKNG